MDDSGIDDGLAIDNFSLSTAAVGVLTSTTLTSITPLTANPGDNVNFTGTVDALSGVSAPTGTVEIRNGGAGGTLLAMGVPTMGFGTQASFSLDSTTIPSNIYNNIQAFFIPNPGFSASNSTVFPSTLTITSPNVGTTTAVTTSNGNVVYGTPVTFTATVTAASGLLSPTAGSVQFLDNGSPLGTTSTIVSSGGGFATFQYTISPNQMQVNGGAPHTITATYTAGTGFTGSTSSGPNNASQTITARPLTASGGSANSKVYDGTATATLNLGSITLNNVVAGDTVTPVTGGATGAFADKHVLTGKTVTVSGITLGGTPAANYTLTQPTYTADITQRPITVTATTNSRAYNGTTTAAAVPTVTTGSIASGDTANFTESYADKNVGTGKILIPGGTVNDGNSGANYAVTFANASTGVITMASLTVTGLTASNKVYDGTTAATIVGTGTLVGVFGTDVVNLVGPPIGTFATRNVGAPIAVAVGGLSLSGADALNYTLAPTALSANIAQRPITVTAATDTKGYDRTTSSVGVPTLTTGTLGSGDTASFTQTFDTRHVGTGKTLTPTGVVNDGNSGNNYAVTLATNASGIITARPITVTAATDSRGYDGTTNSAGVPTVTTGSIVAGDTGNFTQAFATKHADTGKTLIPAGTVNDGNSGLNYAVTLANNTTGVITQRALTVTAVGTTKPFDGTTTSSGIPVIGPGAVASGDTASFAQTYDTPAVGTGKTIAPAGIVSDGNGGANYTYNFVSVNTGVITAVGTSTTTTVSTSAANVVYGTAVTFTATVVSTSAPTGSVMFFDDTMSVALGSGTLISSSGVTSVWTYTTTATQLDVTVPAAHVIRAEFAGTGTFTNSSGTLSGGETVAPAGLTATGITANSRPYNQSTAASLNVGTAALAGVFAGDTVTLNSGSAVGTFATANAGTGILVTVSGLTISGPDAGNYTLTQPTTTANITALGLTIANVTASGKVYDGTTAATLNTGTAALVGVLSGDTVALNSGGAVGNFATRNIGTSIGVATANFTISGTHAANYTLTQPTTSANIAVRPITVTAVPNTKFFDGTTIALAVPMIAGGLGTGDTANFLETYDTPAIGTGKTLTPSGTVTDGNGGANYAITYAPSNTGTISAPSSFVRRYDFNVNSVPGFTAPGFTASIPSDTLAANGAGWSGGVNYFDTGSGGASTPLLFRDFTWSGDQRTFQIQTTPGGTYSLRLYVGDSRPLGGYSMLVRAYDSLSALPAFSSATTTSGNFAAVVLTGVASASGVVNVDIRPAPGGNGAWVFNGLDIWDQGSPANDPGTALTAPPPLPPVAATRRFDFNAPNNSTATAAGFTASLATDMLATNGAAWTSPVYTFDTGSGGSTSVPLLFQDFAWGQGQQTYQILGNPGTTYSLRLYVGDSRTANGGYAMQARAYDRDTAVGSRPGFTSVSTTSGGFNVLVLSGVTAASGVINLDIQAAPGGNNLWVFNGVDVWNQASPANDPGSALAVPPVPPAPPSGRYDFNAGTNTGTTAAGFTGVLASDTLGANGRGWMTPVNMFNTASGGSTSTPLLYQDFAWGTGLQTFQMNAVPTVTHSVRLYVGDSRPYAYSMWVRAYDSLTPEGSKPVFSPVNTTAGSFSATVLVGVVAPSGIVNVDIAAAPGGNGVWVFNGLDVWDQSSPANDPGQAPQLATNVRPATGAASLTDADLAPLVQEAIARWAAAGLDSAQLAALRSTTYRIADIDSQGGALGLTGPGSNVVTLDDDGAGHGWYIDPTPTTDDEFGLGRHSPAAGKYDLLTVIQHELGHVIGLPDLSTDDAPHDLMTEYLAPGVRRAGPVGSSSFTSAAPPELGTVKPAAVADSQPVAASRAVALPLVESQIVTGYDALPVADRWFAPVDGDEREDAPLLAGVKVD